MRLYAGISTRTCKCCGNAIREKGSERMAAKREIQRALIDTNPFLQNEIMRKDLLRRHAEASARIEKR